MLGTFDSDRNREVRLIFRWPIWRFLNFFEAGLQRSPSRLRPQDQILEAGCNENKVIYQRVLTTKLLDLEGCTICSFVSNTQFIREKMDRNCKKIMLKVISLDKRIYL